jgi:hypothetical protein
VRERTARETLGLLLEREQDENQRLKTKITMKRRPRRRIEELPLVRSVAEEKSAPSR